MGDAHVVYEADPPVGIVRLNRPEKLNAFTMTMADDVGAAVDKAERHEDVVAIVLTGAGRGFCAGLDTGDLARTADVGVAPSTADRAAGEVPALFSRLLRASKPVIAAVNGVAAGGGFVLAMMCDLRFAGESASFTTAFSRRGLIAEHGTSWLLPRMVGLGRALDLLWSARRIDAAEAFRIGFVDRVVPDDELLAAVRSYVADLAANVSPRSMAVMKQQIYRDLSQPFDAACWAADDLMREALDHPDAKEGVASFVERRPPRFAPWTGGG